MSIFLKILCYIYGVNIKIIQELCGKEETTEAKGMDACHLACVILAGSDYFITMDDRLLKYQTEKIQIVTPGEFIGRMEAVDQ
ncbi:MAG: hypothetical protein K2J60_16295 [Acetatifactor sp.]|nr:hypothetical protein [Acetatifactor sp.]